MSVDDHPRALRVDPLPGNQRWDDVPCSPFRLVCFPLRFFWRDIVASLGSLPHRGRTPYGHSLRPRTFPQLTPHAITWSVNARRSLAGAGFHPGRRSAPRASSSGTRQGSTPRRGHPRPLLDPGTWRRPRFWASTGPFSGPILPLPEKGGENATFLGGCGAKSWGSGGGSAH